MAFIFGAQKILPMKHQFEKHYTREEANALLPQIRKWLEQLNRLREDLQRCEKRLSGLTGQGKDIGGETVNNWIRALADMQETLAEFQRREIFIKDLERGLLDFPALMGGKEVFLCWEADEEAVEFWHDLESGYGGRERL
jgi:hypothetical protein